MENDMLEQYLCCYMNYQQAIWAELLPFAEVAYNNSVPSSTGFTIPNGHWPGLCPYGVTPSTHPSSVIINQLYSNTAEHLAHGLQSA